MRSVSLPGFLSAHHPGLIPRIGLIKIDVEGYDARILATLGPLLAAAAPVVIVEWSPSPARPYPGTRSVSPPASCPASSRRLLPQI